MNEIIDLKLVRVEDTDIRYRDVTKINKAEAEIIKYMNNLTNREQSLKL